jgi:hypothetical protein
MCTTGSENGSPMVKHREWKQAVTKAEFDAAREMHDIFNLACMPPIIYYTIMDFQWSIFVDEFTFDWQESSYFWYLWWSTTAYTVLDTLWIILIPHCVRTPKTIVEVCCIAIIDWLRLRTWKHIILTSFIYLCDTAPFIRSPLFACTTPVSSNNQCTGRRTLPDATWGAFLTPFLHILFSTEKDISGPLLDH